jgi:hypothetical protein
VLDSCNEVLCCKGAVRSVVLGVLCYEGAVRRVVLGVVCYEGQGGETHKAAAVRCAAAAVVLCCVGQLLLHQ